MRLCSGQAGCPVPAARGLGPATLQQTLKRGILLLTLIHCSAVPPPPPHAGGAWTIGYKAWGALLAKRLSKAGLLVACLDYRNFPQGNALQMLEDVNTGIAWVVRKVRRGG